MPTPTNLEKVSNQQIADLPFGAGARGMETKPVVCKQFLDMPGMGAGKCFHSPNMDDRYIENLGVNEIFYCAEGELVAAQLDDNGDEVKEVRAEEGEFILLPKGNDYVLKASGVASVNVFFSARDDGWDIGDSYGEDVAEAVENEIQKW